MAQTSGSDERRQGGDPHPDDRRRAYARQNHGGGERHLHHDELLAPAHPDSHRRLLDLGRDPLETRQRIPYDGQKGVQREGDDRRQRADPLEQRQEKGEHRQARDGLQDADGAQQRVA